MEFIKSARTYKVTTMEFGSLVPVEYVSIEQFRAALELENITPREINVVDGCVSAVFDFKVPIYIQNEEEMEMFWEIYNNLCDNLCNPDVNDDNCADYYHREFDENGDPVCYFTQLDNKEEMEKFKRMCDYYINYSAGDEHKYDDEYNKCDDQSVY